MYGNWLPGDVRGFVSNVRDGDGPEVRHNRPENEYDANLPDLERSAREGLVGPPVRIDRDQAEELFDQFRETETVRAWRIFAVSIMANHCHLVVGVPGDPEPELLLKSFKSYASRRLNRKWPKPASGTWWTASGSRRKLSTPQSVLAAIRYVLDQEFPLLTWATTIPELNIQEGRIH